MLRTEGKKIKICFSDLVAVIKKKVSWFPMQEDSTARSAKPNITTAEVRIISEATFDKSLQNDKGNSCLGKYLYLEFNNFVAEKGPQRYLS
jgi:hypothetical protein